MDKPIGPKLGTSHDRREGFNFSKSMKKIDKRATIKFKIEV